MIKGVRASQKRAKKVVQRFVNVEVFQALSSDSLLGAPACNRTPKITVTKERQDHCVLCGQTAIFSNLKNRRYRSDFVIR
jgi:hypothetical protein